MTNEQKERLIKAIEEKFNWNYETNCWHCEIYSDYADQQAFEDYILPEIMKSDNPRDKYYELINDAYLEHDLAERDAVFKEICKTDIGAELDETELYEFISDHAWIDYPNFIDTEIPVNVVIDAGDANYDFGRNDSYGYENVDALSGIAYLAKKQGYALTTLRKAIVSREPSESKFINAVVNEWRNASGGCNATTIFTTMTVNDWFYFQELKQWEKPINNQYYPWKGKGRSYITIDGTADWGLVNYWHGSGSVLEGFLEKDMRIPIRYVWDIIPEVGKSNPYGYSVREIYGCSTDWYTGKVAVYKVHNKLLKKEEK